ncbi:EAL domain-containing response regulator [Rheinheimera sp. NSM]|uniref:EAL domain-containing response regulator n=1 Tax=Rheinheimera sp. NSM TaxID=3457884 RepID=UPI0040370549
MQNLNILIVEDCTIQRLYASRLLHQLQVSAISYAANGEQALKQARLQRFDVMLVDLEMGVMDGVELLRHIARAGLCHNIIIASSKDPLLLTSVATMAEADGLRVLGTIAKPVNIDLLALCLLRIQQRWRDQSPAQAATKVVSADMLEAALATNQLYLMYQPIVATADRSLMAAEVLARWQHPQLGFISPDIFIEAAERYNLIDALTLVVLRQALQQRQQWAEQGADIRLAVNISPLSLPNPDFMQQLLQLLRQYGATSTDIIWEVTESANLTDLAASIHSMASLRLQGFDIAIDDYGTGFANAQQLSRIPATRLKIDRSLVDKISERPQQKLILENTVQLGRRLGLILVAEGVETEQDFAVLAAMGIELLQGYLFAKPMTAADFSQWLPHNQHV